MLISSRPMPRFANDARSRALQHMTDNATAQTMAREGIFSADEMRPISAELKQKLDFATMRIPNTHRGIVVEDPQTRATLRLEVHREGFRLVQFPKDAGRIAYTFHVGEQVVTALPLAMAGGERALDIREKPPIDLSDANLMALLDLLMTRPIVNRMPFFEACE